MPLTGTDDMGAYVDSGENVLATQRPSTHLDIHTSVPALSNLEHDTGTKTTVVIRPAARSATQRR
jgi:hypothetical protein